MLIALSSLSFGLTFDRYHSQTFISQYLRQVAKTYPEIAQFRRLGKSQEGREIALLVLSQDPHQDKPAIYLNGTHHGNEKASTEATLGMIHYLVTKRHDLTIRHLLQRYAIFIQPLVNPDGHARNSRFDARGRDPNRDYAHPERPADDAFNLVETRLVRQLLRQHRFIGSAAYHSGVEAVLWPWCYSRQPSADHQVFRSLGRIIAEAMAIPQYTQSYYDYHTEGEFIDYAYMQHGTYAMTFEVSEALNPRLSDLSRIVNRAIRGTLAFMSSLNSLNRNQVEVTQKSPTNVEAH
jgi:predicted deacylase